MQSAVVSKPWTPHDYQKAGLKLLLSNAVGGLILDMGFGKTSCVLALAKILKEKGIAKRTLVIAMTPRICWSVWPEEVKTWDDFKDLRVEVLHGPKKDEALRRDADIYVINPEGLTWLSLEKRFELLNADVLVVDESTAFKHTNTLRFKLLKYLIPKFRRRYILTGTPSPNGLLDLFGQVYILDQGAALGRYITHYRSAFFTPSGYGGYTWTIKPGGEEAIYERLRPLLFRIEGSTCEMPERIDNTVFVELPTKVRKTYSEIEYLFITQLANGEAITAPTAAAAGVKLRQIANGAMYRDAVNRLDAKVQSEEWVALHDAKLDALEEIKEAQQGKPILVAYEFRHDAERIREWFKDAVFLSDFGANKVQEVVDRWNRGEIAMLCAHPASAGHGLNLQKAGNTVVWYGITWNLEHYQQFNARVLRQGNAHSHVVIHHIVARNTVDEAVMKALKSKNKTQNALLDALKDYAFSLEEIR